MYSSAGLGFGKAERKHTQGWAVGTQGKMLQKMCLQLQEELLGEGTIGAEGTGGSASSHYAANQKLQSLAPCAPACFLSYSVLYSSLSKQTVLLLIMKQVTLLIYLPTQMQDVIERN